MEEPIERTSRETQHIAAEFLSQPAARSHAIQFYEDEAFLVDSAYQFIGAGLRAGDQVLAIATRAHLRAINARLSESGIDVDDANARGQLLALDAQQMLSQLMASESSPDRVRFREQVARTFNALYAAPHRQDAAAHSHEGVVRLRVYGEMVDLLTQTGNMPAAILLEQLWDEVCQHHAFALLCPCDLARFQHAGDADRFADFCKLHTHVLPAERFATCGDRVERLREVTRLQQSARALEQEVRQRIELEGMLRTALRAHSRMQDEFLAAVKREREARARADASVAFKEVFLGVLGHDLRNPLNTILTTTRLMLMRGELEPESHKRLGRVVASGERMHRMIEQILDATRLRLTAGIVVQLGEAADIVPLVSEVVSDTRAAHPSVSLELVAPVPCIARFDPQRMEQVVANLIENAFAHGDPAYSVRVSAVLRDGTVCVSVHNYGAPIDAEAQSLLFEPFKRGGRPQGRSSGLGLGLYISQNVVRAHGGNIAVDSSERTGTRFEIRLPLP
ncbi:MAG TPA: ATP-binding protein [Polyangiales bacterium]|nr:ATP-binding protein [Polyangiales bacterium]